MHTLTAIVVGAICFVAYVLGHSHGHQAARDAAERLQFQRRQRWIAHGRRLEADARSRRLHPSRPAGHFGLREVGHFDADVIELRRN